MLQSLLLSFMMHKFDRWFLRLCVGIPMVSFGLGLLAWLRYGVDIPWFDDWRGYADQTIRSLDLRYLFRPVNDTMAPIGFALDALAQRYLDGNSVAYQFVSMLVVLGALLALQWKILCAALGSSRQAAVCFVLTLFMLQPGSYWGLENLAYHQCLPLVFILSALWLVAFVQERKPWHGPAIFALGLLSGFTYVSGAFGALAAGVCLYVVSVVRRGPDRDALRVNALWLLTGAAIAAFAQFHWAVMPRTGLGFGIPKALPHEAHFWWFYLGKLGRSLLLPQNRPLWSLVLSIALGCMALVAALAAMARINSATDRERKVSVVYVALFGVVAIYLCIVSAARANFRPEEMRGMLDIFAYAFGRFHFFWATLLWPWLAALAIVHAPRLAWLRSAMVKRVAAMVTVSLVTVWSWRAGGFAHMAQQAQLAESRKAVAHCLLEQVQARGEIHCVGMLPPRFEDAAPDASGAYAYAVRTKASFVRYFPRLSGAPQEQRK
jgi:hypothetical protein